MTTQLADYFMRFVAGDSSDDLKPVELVSPLPLEECCRRLRAGMDETMLGVQLAFPVVGRIKEGKAAGTRRLSCSWSPEIYMRRQRNSFKTLLSADLIDQSGQTRIVCRFSMHPFVMLFTAFWFGIVLLSIVGLSSSSVLVGPVVMIAFAFGLLRFGRYQSRDDREALLAFVRERLKAEPA
jgi:hypothetical protein